MTRPVDIAAPTTRAPAAAAEPMSFRDRQFRWREEAILDAANRLLATKGFETMSMDDLAAAVGIAKGSLYKHFDSKEALAGATMTRLLRAIDAHLQAQDPALGPIDRLKDLLAWALRERAAGRMPLLPSTSQSVQQALLANRDYVMALEDVGNRMADLVQQAAEQGRLRADLPVPVILYAVYARSCDPSFEYLRQSGEWSDDEVIAMMISSCFDGLAVASPRA
ncbi:MAG: helix-turn-helix domain-containing protein [Burkholderiaceae bacterium]|nr:helix-turn-helix domain-containing protein [Burkholderiaceae bacterium]